MNHSDFFSMSDNLYYLDQLGSVDDQISWLSSFNIVHAQHVVSRCDGQYVLMVVRKFYRDRFFLTIFKVYPGITVSSFLDFRVVNLPRWFLNNGFCVSYHIVEFKFREKCIEEEEDTAVVPTVGAVDLSLSGD